jgi:hypothetical protein
MSLDHTLVIPTYNRPELVRRLVTYYLQRGTDIQMLVLDSSKAGIAQLNGEWFKDRAANVRYVAYPETTQPASSSRRNATRDHGYASFCGDDDLVFPQGLSDAIRF